MKSNILISISQEGLVNKETIHDTATKLKVGVIDPVVSGFKPQKGEKHYFVSDIKNNIFLAFETIGYKKAYKKLLILEMIAQYCVHFGFVEAQIHATWPILNL